jgi:hypothetical protein
MTEFVKLGFIDGEYVMTQSIHKDIIRESLNSRLPGLAIKRIIDQFSEKLIQHYIEEIQAEQYQSK